MPLLGAVAPIAGAAIASSSAQKTAAANNAAAVQQSQQQYANDMETAKMQRKWNLADRDEFRAYDHAQRMEAREYDRAQIEEARTYSRQVLGNLVKDAEAAGFNPLTVLRGGGGAGYNAAAGFAPALSAPHANLTPSPVAAPNRRAPLNYTPDTGAAYGEAFTHVGNFLQNFDPHADDKQELESALVTAQIANLNASTQALQSQSFKVPTATGGTKTSKGSAVLSKYEPHPARFGGPLTPEIEVPKVVNPWPGAFGIHVSPNTPNAEQFEDRYGEHLGSLIGTAVTLPMDIGHNVFRLIDRLPDYFRQSYGGSGKRNRLGR